MPPPVTCASARTSACARRLADLVEVEGVRREQQVGVEVVVSDECAHEREAVGVQSARGEADDGVARLAA